MGRRNHVWERKGRGFYAYINGTQEFLARDRAEAERQFHLRKLDRAPKTSGQHTIPELISLYLAWFAARVSKGQCKDVTLQSYRYSLQSWEAMHWQLKPDDMRAYHATAWLAANPQWSPTTAHTRVRHVRLWAEWCEGEGYLDANRLRRAKSPTPERREPAPSEELARLFEVITEPRFRDFYAVLYDTGARPGEIATLEAHQVGWSSSSAVVHGKIGDRVIGLTKRALDILRAASERVKSGPLLLTKRGNPWNTYSELRAFWKWLAVAGIKTNIVPYSCRHDLYVRWHKAGISDVLIARQLGHISRGVPHIKLLVSTYGHPDAEMLANAANQASSAKREKSG